MIMKHKAVLDVAVFGFPPEGEKRGAIMKVWITLKPMFVGKVTENQLKSWIEKSFYNWRLMGDIEFIGKLPKAVLGKVQKRTPGSITKTKVNK
jgi:fatty-acyl-CoA synthase